MASGYEQKIWNYLKSKLGNEYGVAGLMGNLQAESGLYPNRKEGDIPYSNASVEYTRQVDTGEKSKNTFVNDAIGYGLAQWTYPTRKQGLYEKWKSGGYSSIGSIDLALDFLWYELTTYSEFAGVLSVLKSATSIRQASDKVLHDFENPREQGTSVEETRASMSQAYYNQFHGTGDSGTGDDNTGDSIWKPSSHKMSLILMYGAIKRRM